MYIYLLHLTLMAVVIIINHIHIKLLTISAFIVHVPEVYCVVEIIFFSGAIDFLIYNCRLSVLEHSLWRWLHL